jgi:hypothetical protein
MRRRNKYLLALAIVVVVLVGIRLALEPVLLRYANDKLDALPAYGGHIDDLDLALLRGGYDLKGVEIVKTGAGQPVPFIKADRIEATCRVAQPPAGPAGRGRRSVPPAGEPDQGGERTEVAARQGSQLGRQFRQLFPFRFNTVAFTMARSRSRRLASRPRTRSRRGTLTARCRTSPTSRTAAKETFARFGFTAEVLDGGKAKLDGSIDPLALKPTFDLELGLKNVQLPQVNPWLTRFIKADAEQGEFELYMELAAADGKFKGYAKPVMRDVNIYSSKEPEKNPLKRLWEGIVDVAANIFENHQEDQVAARIPLSGTIEHPNADLFATIGSVLHNASSVRSRARSRAASRCAACARACKSDDGEKQDG